MRLRSIVVFLGAIFISCSAQPSFAHTVLVDSIPKANSIIKSLPATVSITFAENLIEIGNSNSISVLDPNGEEVSVGEVSVNGPKLSKNLQQSDKHGKFTVSYRAVAADGHVIKDDFIFTIEAAAVVTSEPQLEPIESSATETEKKLSTYLIISGTAIAGGLLILFFIWKKQAN